MTRLPLPPGAGPTDHDAAAAAPPRPTLAYLGNRLDAAAFRLAGLAAASPAPAAAAAALEQALASAQLVLLDAAFAQQLPAAQLEAALARTRPLVALVPGATPSPLAPVERARRQLGLER